MSTQNTPAINRTELLNTVQSNLDKLLVDSTKALPSGFNQSRFLQNCLSVLSETNNIEKCSAASIAKTMLKGALLDLDFFRKECYAIPYYDKDKQCHVLNFQTDYKGEIKLAHKYSVRKIIDIYAKVVRDGDVLEIRVENGSQIVNFNPKVFNDGKIIGAFAVVKFVDGSLLYETMSKSEIDHTRVTFSKMPNGMAWKDSEGEMCRKTVLRRICKLIDLHFDSVEQEQAWNDGSDADLTKNEPVKPEIQNPFPTKAVEAVIVTEEEKLRKQLKDKDPTLQDWQIDALVREHKEANQ